LLFTNQKYNSDFNYSKAFNAFTSLYKPFLYLNYKMYKSNIIYYIQFLMHIYHVQINSTTEGKKTKYTQMVAGRKINKLSLTKKRNINGFIKRRRNYLASFYIYTNNENDSTHYYSYSVNIWLSSLWNIYLRCTIY